MVNIKLHLYFPGWVGVGVVIIKLKANLSSISHLTSQLELSLAIIVVQDYLRLEILIFIISNQTAVKVDLRLCCLGFDKTCRPSQYDTQISFSRNISFFWWQAFWHKKSRLFTLLTHFFPYNFFIFRTQHSQ